MQTQYILCKILETKVRQNFQPTVFLDTPFDGKLFASQDGTNHDTLAIVVCALDVENLLGISRKWSSECSRSDKVCDVSLFWY